MRVGDARDSLETGGPAARGAVVTLCVCVCVDSCDASPVRVRRVLCCVCYPHHG